jgi:hypothetical protein
MIVRLDNTQRTTQRAWGWGISIRCAMHKRAAGSAGLRLAGHARSEVRSGAGAGVGMGNGQLAR